MPSRPVCPSSVAPSTAAPVRHHSFAVFGWLLAPAFLLGAPVGPAPARVAPPGHIDADMVAKNVQRFYDGTQGFAADFTQVVRKKGLKKGLPPLTGRVYLKKGHTRAVPPAKPGDKPTEEVEPGKMRWDYPAQDKYYFSDGVVLWSYERRERLAVKLPVKNSRLYQATSYLVGQGQLSRDFLLKLVKSPLPDSYALELVPKEGAQVMQSLTLVVDSRTFAVRASILVDPLGDSITLHFSKPAYTALDDKVFAWQPPAGVTVKSL